MAHVAVGLYTNEQGTPPRPGRLGPGIVHVWRLVYPPLPAAQPLAARLAPTLATDERAAAARLLAPADQDRFLLRRAFARHVLGQYQGSLPHQVEIRRTDRGKPFVAASAGLGLAFSCTHTVAEALVAVGAGMGLGIDVEPAPQVLDLKALARLVLAPDEARAVSSGPPDEEQRRFLRIWCRKEACLKMIGAGLTDDLTALSVTAARVAMTAVADPTHDRAAAPVTAYLQDLALAEAHVAALATTCLCPQVTPVFCPQVWDA